MNAAIHFLSGLPRSGSTLLAALLAQNPRLRASMSGPVAHLCEAMMRNMSMRGENGVFFDDTMREAMLRSVFSTYYAAVPADHVVFDTNRNWCAKLHIIRALYPKARVICCVRDMPDIYDSIERLVRRNKFQPSGIFGFEPGGTVYSRIDQLSGGGMVGFAWAALREAFFSEHTDIMLAITYKTLTSTPKLALEAIYDFIGEPYFDHDFENVEFKAGIDFDKKLGTPGLHSVGRVVKFQRHQPVLPPDIIRRFANDSFWFDPARNPNHVRVI